MDDERNRRQIDRDQATIVELQQTVETLQKSLHDTLEEYALSQEKSEETTKMKIYMEQNMKHLHALHRNTQAKYKRALQDIYDLQRLHEAASEKATAHALELASVKGAQIEHLSTIERLQGERALLESEVEA